MLSLLVATYCQTKVHVLHGHEREKGPIDMQQEVELSLSRLGCDPDAAVSSLSLPQLALTAAGDWAARRSVLSVRTTPAATPPRAPACVPPATPAPAARMVSALCPRSLVPAGLGSSWDEGYFLGPGVPAVVSRASSYRPGITALVRAGLSTVHAAGASHSGLGSSLDVPLVLSSQRSLFPQQKGR